MGIAPLSGCLEFGISLLVAVVVWRYYRHSRYLPAAKYATFGPRFLTGLVDSFVLSPPNYVFLVLLATDISRGMAIALVIAQGLIWPLYTILMHGQYGQTVGKMVTRVKVVNFRTESRISFRQAFLRESVPMVLTVASLLWEANEILAGRAVPGDPMSYGQPIQNSWTFGFLTAIPVLWFVAEIVTMLTNEKRRALHDFIAGTVVIRTNTQEERVQADVSPVLAN